MEGNGGGMSIHRGDQGWVGRWTSLWYTNRCSAVSVEWIGVVEKGVLDEQLDS